MFAFLFLNASLSLGQGPVADPVVPNQPEWAPLIRTGLDNPTSSIPPPIKDGGQTIPPPVKDAGPAIPPPTKDSGQLAGAAEKEKADKNPYGYWFLEHGLLYPGDSKDGFFVHRLYKAYYDQFFPPEKDPNAPTPPEPPRRAMPSPWHSPPFPGSEYQGYPLIGVPADEDVYPFMQAVYGGPWGDAIKESRIKFDGWVTAFGNWGTARKSNVPDAYWVNPNEFGLDQIVFRLERLPDTVQTDHIDWGFRSIALYGEDYRYTTAGGYGSDQLLKHNLKMGWDPVEQYFDVYIPGFLGGTDIRVGRWIACPDIETQYAPDNYMGSHSILFTVDTYTQTGIMLSQKLNDQMMLQFVVNAGTDMAVWYKGSNLTGAVGFRWVSKDNNDAFYTWLNAINSAQFRHFEQYGQPLGHDNFNYLVTTWEHRFSEAVNTKTEAYYMWQYNAEVGGTPSAGPPQSFGGGGGDGVLLPGLSRSYGVLNFTMFGLTERDFFTVRNEFYRDERGMRTGYAGTYTSSAIGLCHQMNDVLMIRPEIGYYRNYNEGAFDLGEKRGIWIYGFDVTYRF